MEPQSHSLSCNASSFVFRCRFFPFTACMYVSNIEQYSRYVTRHFVIEPNSIRITLGISWLLVNESCPVDFSVYRGPTD